MGGPAYRRACKFLFVLKALLAIVLGTAAMGGQVYLVCIKFKAAKPQYLPPVLFPAIGTPEAARCFYNPSSSLARLEPPQGAFFFGLSPQWVNGQLPADVSQRLGYNAPLYNTFISLTTTSFQPDIIEWNCQLVSQQQGVLELTLIPQIRADQIPSSFYPAFAQFMRSMNSKYGVPILLRFMPEMNGNWMKYGQQPAAQIAAWKLLAQNLRAQTNMTALVWSPNVAAAYQGMRRGDPTVSTTDFAAMDTNNNGVLEINDNPFDPYYPGDEYVDWIGISDYNYNRDSGHNVVANQPDVFTSTSGASSLFNPAYPFYSKYVTGKDKPFIFSETGAPVESNLPGNATYVTVPATLQHELLVKQAWWRAVFSSSVQETPGTSLSKLKAAVWFEETKPEQAFDARTFVQKDFMISAKPQIAQAFAADIQALGSKITYPGGFSFSCAGQFNIAGLGGVKASNAR